MITFAEDVIEERDFTVERGGADAAGLKQIRAYVGGLQLHDGTAIFTAMQRLPAGRRRRAARPGRLQGDPWLPVGSGCSATPSWTRPPRCLTAATHDRARDVGQIRYEHLLTVHPPGGP